MATAKTKPAQTEAKKASVSDLKAKTALQGEDFYKMVSEAAFYRAEKRGFVSGQEMEDWIEAEAEIEELQKEELVA